MPTAKSPADLVRAAKGDAGTLKPDEVRIALQRDDSVLIDVREPGEWAKGHIRGALRIPRGTLEFKIGDAVGDKDVRIVTYCAAGSRAALAASSLKSLGYAGAIASEAGYDDLAKHGFVVEHGED